MNDKAKKEVDEGVQKEIQKARDGVRQIKELKEKAQNYVKETGNAKTKAEKLFSEIDKATQTIDSAKKSVDKVVYNINELNKNASEEANRVENIRTKVEAYANSIERAIQGVNAALINLSDKIRDGFSSNERGAEGKNNTDSRPIKIWIRNNIGIILTIVYVVLIFIIFYSWETISGPDDKLHLFDFSVGMIKFALVSVLIYLIIHFIVIGFMSDFSSAQKRFWFSLAIAFFVFASTSAYVLIWHNSVDGQLFTTPHDFEDSKIKSSTGDVCAQISIKKCETRHKLFAEYENIECTLNVQSEEDGFNTSICPPILVRYRYWHIDDEKEKTPKCMKPIYNYGEYTTHEINLGPPGLTRVELQFVCCNVSNCSIESCDSSDVNWSKALTLNNTVYIKTRSEINEQRSEIAYQFILALFALFGIFPATFYLRRLWRGE